MKRICISLFLSLATVAASAQSARELFDAAKSAYENGKLNESAKLIAQCEQSLGKSNPKIESLKTHIYYSNSDWKNAYLSAERYFRMAPASNKGTVAHTELETIRRELTGKMKQLHKDHFETIDEKRMEQANKVTRSLESAANQQSSNMRTRSEKRLQSIYLASSDYNMLKEYTDMFGESGSTRAIEEKKVYLRYIINGDKFAAEKNWQKALDHYESGYQFIKSDSLARRIRNVQDEMLYRKAEASSNLNDYLAYAEKFPSGMYSPWTHTTLVRYYKEQAEAFMKKKDYPNIYPQLSEASKYLKHCSSPMKEKYYTTLLAAAHLLEDDRKAIRKNDIRCKELINYYTYYLAYKPTTDIEKRMQELKVLQGKWHGKKK